MLLRFMPLLLPGVLLVQCAPAGMVTASPSPAGVLIQKEPELVVASREQLAAELQGWIACAQNPVRFRLAAPLKSQWLRFTGAEVWGEYARRCSATYMEDSGHTATMCACAPLCAPRISAPPSPGRRSAC